MLKFSKYILQLKPLILFILILFLQNNFLLANQSKLDTTNIIYLDIKAGDICLVCDMQIKSSTGIGVLFDGRRVTLDLEHLQEFIKNPENYFHKLQVNAALYDEGVFNKYQINFGWFVFGVWVVFALISSAVCVNISMKRELNIKRWFFIGLSTNIFGLAYLIFSTKKESVLLPEKFGKIALTEKPVKCKGCGEYNHPSAIKCTTCDKKLISKTNSEVINL